mgnify:CR=1 FL=1
MKLLVRRFYALALISVLSSASAFCQMYPFKEVNTLPDTLYYPFYDGVQMIEVDHDSYTRILSMRYSSMSQPPNLYFSRPLGNEIFMRDSLGVIVRSYNTSVHQDSLNLRPISYVNSLGNKRFGGNGRYNFIGYNRRYAAVYNEALFGSTRTYKNKERLRKGLIDSLGHAVLPIEFQEIIIEDDLFITQKNGKWGLLDISGKTIVSHSYESYSIEDDLIFFRNEDVYKLAYHRASKRIIDMTNYAYPIFYKWDNVFIVKQGDSLGLVDIVTNRIIIPCEYQNINTATYKKSVVLKVYKNKKFGIIDKEGKVLLDCNYDGIHFYREENGDSFKVIQNDSTFLVKPR